MMERRQCECGRHFIAHCAKTVACRFCRKNRYYNTARRNRAESLHRNGGTHSPEQWWQQVERQLGLCFYCSKYLLDATGYFLGHKEHRTPVSRGGRNDIANIVAACAHCNVEKHDLTEEEYIAYLRRKFGPKSEPCTGTASAYYPSLGFLENFWKYIRQIASDKKMDDRGPLRRKAAQAQKVRLHSQERAG